MDGDLATLSTAVARLESERGAAAKEAEDLRAELRAVTSGGEGAERAASAGLSAALADAARASAAAQERASEASALADALEVARDEARAAAAAAADAQTAVATWRAQTEQARAELAASANEVERLRAECGDAERFRLAAEEASRAAALANEARDLIAMQIVEATLTLTERDNTLSVLRTELREKQRAIEVIEARERDALAARDTTKVRAPFTTVAMPCDPRGELAPLTLRLPPPHTERARRCYC